MRLYYTQDHRSYYQQFQDLKGSTDLSVLNAAFPKPSPTANSKAPTAAKVPLSDVTTCAVERPLLAAMPKTLTTEEVNSTQEINFFWRTFGFILVHVSFPAFCWSTFSWSRLAWGLLVYNVTGIFGISMCYHRLLAHRSFRTYRVVEYLMSIVAILGMQGPPMEWASNHRWHHLHCDTPLDPHSPYEGFYHAHMGWLFKAADVERPLLDRSNVQDLAKQRFYRVMEEIWVALLWARFGITWALFGWPMVIWSLMFPIFAGLHVTFLVNSAAHLWGSQPYDTGDLSRNNRWLALVTFGEGWHNNYHAFASSARIGLEWMEFDPVYYCLIVMSWLGLAWDIKVPTEKDKARKRRSDPNKRVAQPEAEPAGAPQVLPPS